MKDARLIVVFDGYCNLCSKSVDFIMKRDKKSKFLFAANQSETGKQFLSRYNRVATDSVLFITDNKCYSESTAVLRILGHLGFPWILMQVFLILPLSFRNYVYRYFAARRYRWWGKRSSCRTANREELEKFLP